MALQCPLPGLARATPDVASLHDWPRAPLLGLMDLAGQDLPATVISNRRRLRSPASDRSTAIAALAIAMRVQCCRLVHRPMRRTTQQRPMHTEKVLTSTRRVAATRSR